MSSRVLLSVYVGTLQPARAVQQGCRRSRTVGSDDHISAQSVCDVYLVGCNDGALQDLPLLDMIPFLNTAGGSLQGDGELCSLLLLHGWGQRSCNSQTQAGAETAERVSPLLQQQT